MVLATVRVRHLAVTAMSKSTTLHRVAIVHDRTPNTFPLLRTVCGRTMQAIELTSSIELDDSDGWVVAEPAWKACLDCRRSS